MQSRAASTLGGLVIAACLGSVLTAPAAQAAVSFANCTAVHQTHPHGIGRAGATDRVSSGRPVTTFTQDTALYGRAVRANAGLDRDRDQVACEKR